jgi:phosphoglycerol transferase MdoB-like AlkP superfamily enzyme
MLKAIETLIKVEKGSNHESEFESLETLLTFVASRSIVYSQGITESITGLLTRLKVTNAGNQQR